MEYLPCMPLGYEHIADMPDWFCIRLYSHVRIAVVEVLTVNTMCNLENGWSEETDNKK